MPENIFYMYIILFEYNEVGFLPKKNLEKKTNQIYTGCPFIDFGPQPRFLKKKKEEEKI